jgi:hypothetical protein
MKGDWDLNATVHEVLDNWCSDMNICFYWVKGHLSRRPPMLILKQREGILENINTYESLDANLDRAASLVKLKKSMEKWHLPNDFWIAIEKGVSHTTNHTGTMNIVPPPFTISTLQGTFNSGKHSKINPR